MQKSPIYFDQLKNIAIHGNTQSIALFTIACRATIALGDHEHTGDWDPYLSMQIRKPQLITALNGSQSDLDELLSGERLQSCTGYPEITFGDFNDEDNETPLTHHEKITNILIECEDPNDEENTITLQIPISCIEFISLER